MHEAASKALFEADIGGLRPRLLTSRKWKVYEANFPILDVGFQGEARTELRVRFRATNWNDEPPVVELLDAAGEYLIQLPNPGGIFNNGPHPDTKRPFICMAGAREYHTHPSHLDDRWGNYKSRSDFSLCGILTQIWNAWGKTKS